MSSSIIDITSQRLKKVKLFIEHMKSHPVHLESLLKLEREAVYKPLSPELKSVVLQTLNSNVIYGYNEAYFLDLKNDLASYLDIEEFDYRNLFIASNLYNFYEYLTELFLQKDQKVLLYTADDFSFEQEAKYLNSGRILIETTTSPAGCLGDIYTELHKEDYKIVILCLQDFNPDEMTDLVDLLPENVVLVLRTSNPLAFNYINHGNKTVIVLRTFPSAMTVVEPPISFAVSRKEVIAFLNCLQNPNHLDSITLFISKYYTSLDNPVEYKLKSYKRSTEGYSELLRNIIRENLETIEPKEKLYNKFTVSNRLKIPMNEVFDFSSGDHFLGLSEDLKASIIEFVETQEPHNYYSQRTLLRNMIANDVSTLNKKFHYNNVYLGAGVSGLLESVTRAFVNDGEGYKKLYKDKALILDYSPDIYTRVVEKRDARVDTLELKPGLVADVDEIISKLKHLKPKLLLLDNPRGIVGTYFDKNQLRTILQNLPEQTICIIDESYYKYADYEKEDFVSAIDFVEEFSNLIVLRSFSSVYAMAGMRLGYAIAQEHIINCIEAVRHPFDISPFAIYMGIKILQSTDVFEKVTLKYVQEQKQAIYQYLSEMGLFYLQSATNSIVFSTSLSSKGLQERLLPYKILVKPLKKNFVRMSISEQKNNVYFIKSLKMALGSELHH